MDPTWIVTSWEAAAMTVVNAVGIYAAVILFTRLAGLRSFSKMSSFDFAMTVAVGSLIASTVLMKDPPLLKSVVALASLYLLQIGVALLRQRSDLVEWLVDNRPVLLMENGRMIEEAMRKQEVTRMDLVAKLREANVLDFSEVRAVVLETTGDISVLHAASADRELDAVLLEGVVRH